MKLQTVSCKRTLSVNTLFLPDPLYLTFGLTPKHFVCRKFYEDTSIMSNTVYGEIIAALLGKSSR